MMKTWIVIVGCTLFFLRAGYTQTLKVSIEGIKKTELWQISDKTGPAYVKDRTAYFTYGCRLSYEKNKNGLELNISKFPYHADILFSNVISFKGNPSSITLISGLYRRNLLNLNRKTRFYLMGGIGLGKFQYIKQSGGGIVEKVNNVVVFTASPKNYSNYDKSTILIPTLKAEIERDLFWHLTVGFTAAYHFKNWFGYHVPLEQQDYWYEYTGQPRRTGTIKDFGNGYQLSLSLKYRIQLKKQQEEPGFPIYNNPR